MANHKGYLGVHTYTGSYHDKENQILTWKQIGLSIVAALIIAASILLLIGIGAIYGV